MSPAPTLRDRTRRGLIWASAEAGARAVLQIIVLAVLARLLSPQDYGVVGAAMIVVGISTIFSQLGVGPAVVQRAELKRDHLDAAFCVSVILGVLTAGALWLLAPALAAFFRIPALVSALHGLAVVFPVAGFGVVSESLLQRDLRFDLLARAEVVSYGVGYGLVGIVLAWCGWGFWSLVCAQSVQMIVRTDFLFHYHAWRPRMQCRRGAVGDLFHFSSGLTVARLANYLATNGDNLVVGRYLGAEALGVYGRAYALMSQPANLIGNVLEKVLFPAMAKVQESNDQLARVYRSGVGLLATAMLPASAAIYLLAPEAVELLLGPKWRAVGFPLQIFAAGLLFRTSMKMSNSLIRAKGAVYQMAWCQIVYAAAIVGFAWACRDYGIEGVCVGVLIAIFLCFVLAAAISLRLIRVKWSEYIGEHLPGLILGAAVYGAGWLPCSLLRAQHAPAALVFTASLASMALLGGGLAFLFPATFLGPEGARFADRLRLFFAKPRPVS